MVVSLLSAMSMPVDTLLSLLALIALSGFFSAAETALFSISPAEAIVLGNQPGRANALIHRMKQDPDRLLNTILIGNTLANMAAAAQATAFALQVISVHAVAIATGVMTLLVLVFGEVFPKSLAIANAIPIARVVIVPIYWLSKLLLPLVLALNVIPRMAARIRTPTKVTEADLLSIVEAKGGEGEFREEERELIHNIFEFDDTSASEIMTPRADMFVIDVNAPLDLPALYESGFTRIPVTDGDIDRIIGILNIKDLLLHQCAGGPQVDVRRIMRQPYFVPEHKKLNLLLQGFKRRKQHMAIVVDEHGGVSGLITLEDALEELVGEIVDETDDVEEPSIIPVSGSEWRVLGKAEIDEVNEALQMRIPDTGEYETFSGYILKRIGRIPKVSEEIEIGEFTVIVKEREGNRIVAYLVRRNSPPALSDALPAV
ncbi:MAG: hemolysin family protein [Desulfobacterales bacterium]